jgi:hypothetical protein
MLTLLSHIEISHFSGLLVLLINILKNPRHPLVLHDQLLVYRVTELVDKAKGLNTSQKSMLQQMRKLVSELQSKVHAATAEDQPLADSILLQDTLVFQNGSFTYLAPEE